MTRGDKTKRLIPEAGLRVHHVLPRVPHNTSIIIIINWNCTGKVQGTFGSSWSVDACEHSSQPQEALKESTQVDAEYNLPTGTYDEG
jgi:hypothetical protein